MTSPLKTTSTNVSVGLAFGAFAPTAIAISAMLPFSLIPGYGFLGGLAVIVVAIGGPVAMLLVGLPVWGVLHLLRVNWRVAGLVGAAAGLGLGWVAAQVTFSGCEASPPQLIDQLVTMSIAVCIGAITGAGLWRLAYPAPRRSDAATVF